MPDDDSADWLTDYDATTSICFLMLFMMMMNCEMLCDKLFDLFFFKIVQEICRALKKRKALVVNISFYENIESS